MITYTTALAIGLLRLTLHTTNAGLYAAQQRAYRAFAGNLATRADSLQLRFDFTPGTAPAAWPFAFEAGRLNFTAADYTGTIDLAQHSGQLTFSSTQVFEAADYFVRTAVALLAFEAGGLLFHAAGLAHHDRGYAFFGYSGSGKTTVARVSPQAVVLNDDLVVLLPQADGWHLHATPFSNPTQIQPAGDRHVLLAGLYRLIQDRRVFLEPLDPAVALAEVVASCPIVCADPDRAIALLDRATQLTHAVPVHRLHFLPDDSFWRVIDPA